MLTDDPELERDIVNLCRTPQFRRLKRYVEAEDAQNGEPVSVATDISDEIKEKLLSYPGADGQG